MTSYLDRLDQDLSERPRFKKPPIHQVEKKRITSTADPDRGYINHGNKRALVYSLYIGKRRM